MFFFNEFFALWQQKKPIKNVQKAFVGREMQKVEIF
jgi:hypothetical protein